MNPDTSAPPPSVASERRTVALLIWSSSENGLLSTGRVLADTLAADPHRLDTVTVDLPRDMAARSLVKQVAGLVDTRLETAVVTSLGWKVVQSALSGKRPDVVVALDPVAAAAVDAWRGKGLLRAPLVGVVPGLTIEPAWAATAVDRLSVADEVQGEEALELGLPEECPVPCGVPVCSGFSSVQPDDKAPLRARFHLPKDRQTLLVVTDGFGDDEITGALFQLSMLSDRVTLLFDVARDDDAADLLRRRASIYGVQARMFGKVDEAGMLWGACDAVLARPHLYVEQRAVALRLPVVAFMPNDQMAQARAALVERRGVGVQVHNLATLAAQIDTVLQPDRLKKATQTLAAVSRRNALPQMARLCAQVAADAEAILAEAKQRQAKPSTPKADPNGPRVVKDGPLEVIGGPTPVEEPADPETPTRTLADVEAAETEAGRQVLQHQQEADRWAHRAQLARERGDRELEQEAEATVNKHQRAMHRALAELARLAEQRQALEGAPERKARRRKLERTFKKMELDDALDDLKRKMGM